MYSGWYRSWMKLIGRPLTRLSWTSVQSLSVWFSTIAHPCRLAPLAAALSAAPAAPAPPPPLARCVVGGPRGPAAPARLGRLRGRSAPAGLVGPVRRPCPRPVAGAGQD